MVANILKVAVSVTEFVADAGIKIFDGLATFVDWGYKAIDATRGFMKTLGGEGLAQNFDKVMGLVGTALTLATAITIDAAMNAADGGYDGPGLLDFVKGKGTAATAKGTIATKGTAAAATGTTAGGGATATAGTAGGLGLGAVIAIVAVQDCFHLLLERVFFK
jgi:hypothetical protein